MNYQWYPGHMTKAKRMMQENIKLIDLIIEVVDARIPVSSRNPDIDELGKNKARLILLNKSDLADERQNEKWTQYFMDKGFCVVKANSKSGGYHSRESCRWKSGRVFHRGGTEESLYGAWQRSIQLWVYKGKDAKIARLRDSRNQGKTPDT